MGAYPLLFINTAFDGCVVALCDETQTLAEASIEGRFGQSEHLLPLIADLYLKAGMTFADTKSIAVITGPGSFTGIRVGLAVATTMKAVLKCPCYGLNGFDVYNAYLDRQQAVYPRLCLIETYRDDYFAEFRADAHAKPTQQIMSNDEVSALCEQYKPLLTGNAATRYLDGKNQQYNLGYMFDVQDVALCLQNKLAANTDQTLDIKPFYLRDADVSISKKQTRSIATGF